MLTGLRELIPCDDIIFQLMDVAEQRLRQLVVSDEGVQREDVVGGNDDYAELFWKEWAEMWSPRAWASTPMGSASAAMSLTDEILVPMTPLGGTDRRLLLFRLGVQCRTEAVACVRAFLDAA